MICNHLSLCLLGIAGRFLVSIVAVEAVVNEFPYEVSLQFEKLGHVCGGTIIGEKLILTAARCVVDKHNELRDNPMSVVAGTNDLHNIKAAVTMAVERIFVPLEYDRWDSNSLGDIAVLKLKHSLGVWRHRHLEKLKLPTEDETYAGKRGMISGFGHLKLDNKNGHNDEGLLDYAKTDIISNGQCQLRFPRRIITDKLVCARFRNHPDYKPSFAYSGDSLVYEDKIIVGILSLSSDECNDNSDTSDTRIYTRVSEYLYFIERAVKQEEKDKDNVYRTLKLPV